MQQTTIWVTGINHDTTPLAVRERFALSEEALDRALRIVRSFTGDAVLLSTCNRLELYALLENNEQPGPLLEAMTHKMFLVDDAERFSQYAYSHRFDAAIRHLFRVAAGIDSLVLGEVQILGQVQRAWQAAHKAGVAGPVLSQLFHRAVAFGKRVQTETPISRRPASISYAAVMCARQIFGSQLGLSQRHVLVIGTGEVGEGVARCLHDYGVHATVVAHRQTGPRFAHAQAVARRYNADMASWDDLPHCLASADIVISSTAAPHYILQPHQVAQAMHERAERSLYLIDLAVPRDIDPGVAELPGVHLHNIDDLQAVVHSTLEERRSALPEIEAMIEVETAKFSGWLMSRTTAPMLKELRAQAGEVTRKELDWAMSKMPDLTDRERQVVEAMASRIAGKLLHGPIQWLKNQAENTRTGEEPDYGMSRLTQREITELFYRKASIEDVSDQH